MNAGDQAVQEYSTGGRMAPRILQILFRSLIINCTSIWKRSRKFIVQGAKRPQQPVSTLWVTKN